MKPPVFKIAFLLFGIFSILSASPPSFAALITDVRSWSAPDQVRVVLDLTEPVHYESFSQETPPLCQVEISGAALFTKKRELEVNDLFLSRITLTDIGEGKVKLVIHQKRPLEVNILLLKPYLDKSHRLVIDLVDVVKEKREQEERIKQKIMKDNYQILKAILEDLQGLQKD